MEEVNKVKLILTNATCRRESNSFYLFSPNSVCVCKKSDEEAGQIQEFLFI